MKRKANSGLERVSPWQSQAVRLSGSLDVSIERSACMWTCRCLVSC